MGRGDSVLQIPDQGKESAPIALDSNSDFLTRLIEDEPTAISKDNSLANNTVFW